MNIENQSDETRKNATKERLDFSVLSQEKKLEYLARHLDPADFPPTDQRVMDLLKEFKLHAEDPFTLTNDILRLLDKIQNPPQIIQ
jgi:hypothetical protein